MHKSNRNVSFSEYALAPFVLVSAVRNAEKYIERCMLSITAQRFKYWHTILIDDQSSDKTLQTAKTFIESSNLEKQFTLISNDERLFALNNIVYAIKNHIKNDSAIIGLIDGDDWLASKDTLKKIWDEYVKGYDFLWTQHIRWPSFKIGYSLPANKNSPRNERRGMSHFKTFRKYLFDKIPENEFLDQDGCFLKYASDKAITYPMSELSSNMTFMNEALYVYNEENENNVNKKDTSEQLQTALYLESKKPMNT